MREAIDKLVKILNDYGVQCTTIDVSVMKMRELEIAEFRKDIDRLHSDFGTYMELRAKTQVKQVRVELSMLSDIFNKNADPSKIKYKKDPMQRGLGYSDIEKGLKKVETIKRDPENEKIKNLGAQLKRNRTMDFLDQTLVLKRFIQLNYELSIINIALDYLNIKARTAGKNETGHQKKLEERLQTIDDMFKDLNTTLTPAVGILVREVNSIVAKEGRAVGIERSEIEFEGAESKHNYQFARAMNAVMLAYKLELANLKDKRVDVANAVKLCKSLREVLPNLKDEEYKDLKSRVEALLTSLQPDKPLHERAEEIESVIEALNNNGIKLTFSPDPYTYEDGTSLAVESLMQIHARSVSQERSCIFSFSCFSAMPDADEKRMKKIVELRERGAPQNVLIGAIVKLYEGALNYQQPAQKKTAQQALYHVGFETFFCPMENLKAYVREYEDKVPRYHPENDDANIMQPLLGWMS